MKYLLIKFVLFTLVFDKNFSHQIQNYTNYIEQLKHDETFLDEYTKWSSELFSQSDYLYGQSNKQFPCSIEKENIDNSVPLTVHKLRPNDIKCIAALGDSFTTGLGAHAITPNHLLIENREISWSIGGDYSYSKIVSLPNILRQYNKKLVGFSTKESFIYHYDQNTTNNQLNIANSEDRSIDLIYQAEILIQRLKSKQFCDWKNDWKIVTIYSGINDLCHFCEHKNLTKYSPEQYLINIRQTLDKFLNVSMPRTFINLVLPFDIRHIKDLTNTNSICKRFFKQICPCVEHEMNEKENVLKNFVEKYQQLIIDLINTKRYDIRDDFTVVIQPFMSKMKIPYKDNKIDFSFFAPDCFHLSGKGHSQVAQSLWNNMFEPVGDKQFSWNIEQSLKCPTKENPFFFTSKNSVDALEKLKQTTKINFISSTIEYENTTKKNHFEPPFNRMKSITIFGLIFILIMFLLLFLTRRKNSRLFVPKLEQHGFNNMKNSQHSLEEDEFEVWNRTNIKQNDKKITETFGKRVDFQ